MAVVAVDPLLPRRGLAPAGGRGWRAGLVRWGVSVASLVSGTVALLVFRRGVPHVGWIVGYLVGLWLLFVVLARVRAVLLARGRRLVVAAGEYTLQTLAHGLFLFVLPAYLASTTPDGPTAPFSLGLAAAALLTTIDPWYRAVVGSRPWLGRVLFAGSLFAGLHVALGLLGVAPGRAAVLAAGLAGVALALGVPAPGGAGRMLAGAGGLGALGMMGAWLALPAIPPAPVSLVRPTMARDTVALEPVGPVRRVRLAELRAGGGLVAFTPVAAPAGLAEPIEHVWRHAGRPVLTVRLPVRGGRPTGFRTFSRKTDFPPDAAGRWTVDVWTVSGQLVGRLRFTVDD